MSPHAPPHLAKIAPVLMAGEDVRYMSKSNPGMLLVLEGIVAAGSFVVLFAVVSIFSDLPMITKACLAALAAVAGIAIMHFTVGMRTYVVTDQRLLVVAGGLSSDVVESCELGEIESITKPGFGNSLIVQRTHGKPIRLWALPDRDACEVAISPQD